MTNPMTKQEFNRLAAEFLGLEIDQETVDVYVVHDNETMPREFNPYDDANDMLLLEEKLKIRTRFYMNVSISTIQDKFYYRCEGKTPHESRRACAEEYLKEWESDKT